MWGKGGLRVSSKQKKQNSPKLLAAYFSPLSLLPGPPPTFSIILPVYNEAGVLGETLAGLPAAPDLEVIVVDGGSTDGSPEVASRFPSARLLQTPKGRGLQMNAGARAARGEFFVFLHADTALGPAHLAALRRAAADPGFRAGAFELLLTPTCPPLRFIAWGANRRAHVLGLPYGDQALILRRDLFEKLGGFSERRPEDLDLVIRVRRYTRIRLLTPPVASSGRKWREHGYFYTTLKNWLFFAYHLAERTFTSRWPRKEDRGFINIKNKLKSFPQNLKSELKFYRLVLEDPRTPKSAKLLLGIAISYALFPFDLIPDFIPVIGYLDDVVVVGGLAMLAMKIVPKEVLKETGERMRA